MNPYEEDFLLGIESYDSNTNFLIDADSYNNTDWHSETYNYN